jgi:hypothetical protein
MDTLEAISFSTKCIIDFHKSIDEVLRAINGHVFIMHNQHFTVNHLKIIMTLMEIYIKS